MIDPTISLAVQQANVAPAIDIFNRVKQQNIQNRIQDQLLPGQLALQQQQIQAGEQALQQGEQSLQAGAINLQDAQNRQDLSSIAQFAIQNEGAIQNAVKGDTSQLQQNLVKRISDLSQQGRNTDQSVEALQMLQSGRGAEAAQLLSNSVGLAQNAGLLGQRVTETASQKDFNTFKQLEDQAKQSGDPKDLEAAKQFGRQAGFVRPTEQEKADISVDKSIRTEVGKGTAKTKRGFADSGIEAADSVANLKRSIALLDEVKTGGFDGALIKARQLFGIEGADEGELSANLGKAVLAQLKPIFGAAFTAAEGERLERIEAR